MALGPADPAGVVDDQRGHHPQFLFLGDGEGSAAGDLVQALRGAGDPGPVPLAESAEFRRAPLVEVPLCLALRDEQRGPGVREVDQCGRRAFPDVRGVAAHARVGPAERPEGHHGQQRQREEPVPQVDAVAVARSGGPGVAEDTAGQLGGYCGECPFEAEGVLCEGA